MTGPETPLPTIVTFWTGGPLGFVEQLCLTSWIDMGHPAILYSYEKIEGVPAGIECRDASEILPKPDVFVAHHRTESPAPFADKFRYTMLQKRPGIIWADTDAYCLRPFQPQNGYLFADEGRDCIAIGVLAMPADSRALAELVTYCANEYAILPWLSPRFLDKACMRKAMGGPMHVTEFPWGVWGPSAMTYVLRKTGEDRFCMPSDVLYPVLYEDRKLYFKKARLTWQRVTDRTQSIHFYGRRVRDRLKRYDNGVPPRQTILGNLGNGTGF
jgi:hypothetical protein